MYTIRRHLLWHVRIYLFTYHSYNYLLAYLLTNFNTTLFSRIAESWSIWNDLREVLGQQWGWAGDPSAGWKPAEAASSQNERFEGDQLHVSSWLPAGKVRYRCQTLITISCSSPFLRFLFPQRLLKYKKSQTRFYVWVGAIPPNLSIAPKCFGYSSGMRY